MSPNHPSHRSFKMQWSSRDSLSRPPVTYSCRTVRSLLRQRRITPESVDLFSYSSMNRVAWTQQCRRLIAISLQRKIKAITLYLLGAGTAQCNSAGLRDG